MSVCNYIVASYVMVKLYKMQFLVNQIHKTVFRNFADKATPKAALTPLSCSGSVNSSRTYLCNSSFCSNADPHPTIQFTCM